LPRRDRPVPAPRVRRPVNNTDSFNDDVLPDVLPPLENEDITNDPFNGPPINEQFVTRKRGRPKGVVSKKGRGMPRPTEPVSDVLIPPSRENVPDQSVTQTNFAEQQVAPKDFFKAVAELPQTEHRLTRSQARQLLQLIQASDTEDEEVCKITRRRKTKRKTKKKSNNGTSNDKLKERNFQKTGDDFGEMLQVHRGSGRSPLHDEVGTSSSEGDSGGEDDEHAPSDQSSDVEDEDESPEEGHHESESEVSDIDNSPVSSDSEKELAQRPDVPPMPGTQLPGIQQPGRTLLGYDPPKDEGRPVQRARTGLPLKRPANEPIPPSKRMSPNDPLHAGGGSPTPHVVPSPAVFAGGTKDVPHPTQSTIPGKDKSQAPVSQTPQEEGAAAHSDSHHSRKMGATSKPSAGTIPKHPSISQKRDVDAPTNVPARDLQRIMGLMGAAFSASSEIQRKQAHQLLHDALIISPVAFNIDDIPVDPTWRSEQTRHVFRSAAHHRRRYHPSSTASQPARTQSDADSGRNRKEMEVPQTDKGKSEGPRRDHPTQGQPGGTTRTPHTPDVVSRPTRSNTKAPDIPALPSVPIERQSRKDHPK